MMIRVNIDRRARTLGANERDKANMRGMGHLLSGVLRGSHVWVHIRRYGVGVEGSWSDPSWHETHRLGGSVWRIWGAISPRCAAKDLPWNAAA